MRQDVGSAHRRWGPSTGTPTVLVHGSAAHAGWWEHVAADLAADGPVLAPDLSGHGVSGRRAAYSVDGWAAEVARLVAVPAVVVGHSMGAYVALRLAALRPELVAALVLVDPPVRELTADDLAQRARFVAATPKVYPRREDAVARWRPSPSQAVLPGLRERIAEESVVPTDGGWTWHFDPRTFDRPEIAPDDWDPLDLDVTVLRAEHGMLSAPMADVLTARLGPRARSELVPDAGHHVMLDHPEAIVAAVRRAHAHLEETRP